MPSACFVSYEIAPTTAGGCGVLIRNVSELLCRQNWRVFLLLDLPKFEFDRFVKSELSSGKMAENCRAFLVEDLVANTLSIEDFTSLYEWKSWRFCQALKALIKLCSPDYVEFFDYCGPAEITLAELHCGLGFSEQKIAVRLHTSVELMDQNDSTNILDLHHLALYGLERSTLRSAPLVISPFDGFSNSVSERTQSDVSDREKIISPPLIRFPKRTERSEDPEIVLFLGRLFGNKGVDQFVDAAVLVARTTGFESLDYVVCGFDSKQAPDTSASYTDYLCKRIPTQLRSNFRFEGQVNWDWLEGILPNVLCAVFPSRFESFCYAAHELYAAGVPLIARDIPAFRAAFESQPGASLYDGSVTGLRSAIVHHKQNLPQKTLQSLPSDGMELSKAYTALLTGTGKIWEVSIASNTGSILFIVIHERIGDVVPAQFEGEWSGDLVFAVQQKKADNDAGCWWLGRFLYFYDSAGQSLMPGNLLTHEFLLVCDQNTHIDNQFWKLARNAFANHRCQFVDAWRKNSLQEGRVDRLTTSAAFFSLPVIGKGFPSAVLLRCEPGISLIDVVDDRFGPWGIWALGMERLTLTRGFGVTIPRELIEIENPIATVPDRRLFSFMVNYEFSLGGKGVLAHAASARWNHENRIEPDMAAVNVVVHPKISTLFHRMAIAISRVYYSYPTIARILKRLVR